MMRLSYDTPTSLREPHGVVPKSAHINYTTAEASIPGKWRLELNSIIEVVAGGESTRPIRSGDDSCIAFNQITFHDVERATRS